MPENATNNGQQGQQPAMPPSPFANPATPTGFMNADPNELSFLFNEESGELQIAKKQTSQEPPPAVKVDESQVVKETPKADPYEERFQRVEQALVTFGSFLQGLQQGGQQPPKQEEPKQIDYSEVQIQNGNDIANIVRQVLFQELKPMLQPIVGKQDQLGVESSFTKAHVMFGDEFKAALPTIELLSKAGLLNSDPNNTDFVKIFSTLKQAGLIKPTTAPSDSTIQPNNGSANGNGNGKPQSAEELRQKANALSTESPSIQRNFVNDDKPKIKTVEDAVNAAFSTVFGGR